MHPLIRISYIGLKPIDAGWGFTHRSSLFWRLYHDFSPGAAIDCTQGRIKLDPAVVVLVPANAMFTAVPPAKPVRHLYLHFDVLEGGQRLPVQPCAIAVDAALRALIGDGSTPDWSHGDPLQACAIVYRTLALAQLPGRPEDEDEDYWRRYICENLGGHLSVTQLARLAKCTPDYFIRRFARRHGTTPARFIAAERLALARHLLVTTALPLDRIAERCGSASRGHLATAFKLATGTTPMEFRRQHANSGR